MAHYAFLDANNIVIEVITGIDETELIEGLDTETWYGNFRGQTCKRTSYNGNIRKQYAGIGYTYDAINDVFIAPQPFASWSLDENFDWQAPKPKPQGELGEWHWDEDSLSWLQQSLQIFLMHLNDIVETVIVKNLKRRTDRLENISKQLDALNINWLRFDVIDHQGTKASATWWNAFNGLQAIRYAKHANLPCVLVLDDDCVFVDDFAEKFEKLWPLIPPDWDYVSFGEIFGDKKQIAPGVVESQNSWGGHASLIRETIYDLILEKIDGLDFADEQMNRKVKPHAKCYVFSPYLITQAAGFSDHSGDYATNHLFD